MGLAHSTLDFGAGAATENTSDKIMYDYTQYLSSRETRLYKAIAFEDYNHLGGMGFGIQAAQFIDKGSIIFEVPKPTVHSGKEFFRRREGKINK